MNNESAFAFDLDGTITAAEILPRIGREIDLFEEISLLTEATIQGLIPFEKSFKLRCRLLRDVPISTVQGIVDRVPLQADVLAFIHAHPGKCFVVTGNLDVWLEPLQRRIPCPFFASKAVFSGDRLEGVGEILDKGSVVRDLRQRFARVVAIGEGMNDVPMFELAHVRVAHGAIHAPSRSLMQLADYYTVSGGGLCKLLESLS